jgi:hypothetical protein
MARLKFWLDKTHDLPRPNPPHGRLEFVLLLIFTAILLYGCLMGVIQRAPKMNSESIR